VDLEPDQHREITSALANVMIYEVTVRPGYELVTSAAVDDRVFVGSGE
jgi:hypothetical protein